MRFTRLAAYQQINGKWRRVPVRYNVSANTCGFELGACDSSRELVIDPLFKVFPIASSDKYYLLMDLAACPDGNTCAAGVANRQLAVLKFEAIKDC